MSETTDTTQTECSNWTTTVARGAAYSPLLLTDDDGPDADEVIAAAEAALNEALPACGSYYAGLGEVHACLTHADDVEAALADVDPGSHHHAAAQLGVWE